MIRLGITKTDVRLLCVGLAGVGAVTYLAVGVLWIWVYCLFTRDEGLHAIDWSQLWFALPVPILFGTFLWASLSWKHLPRCAALLTLGVMTAAAWSVYDAWNQNYQVGTHSLEHGLDQYHVIGKGAEHHCWTWPWLVDLEPYVLKLKTAPNKCIQAISGYHPKALNHTVL